MRKPRRAHARHRDARPDRRLAHVFGELTATADRWPLDSREGELLRKAARAVRSALRTAPPEDPT